MRVLLVVPPSSWKEGFGKFNTSIQPYFPLGLAYVAAFLEKERHKVKVIDAVVTKSNFDDIERVIRDFSPHIVGQQTIFSNLESCYKIAKIAKRINPDIKVVLGGSHITMYPEETIRDESIDFGVYGEGEFVMKNLLDCLQNGIDFSGVPGIVWKDGKNIIKNKPQPFIENLDILPFPAKHLFPMNKYHATSHLRGIRTLSMIASRGCPFRCVFCWIQQSFGRTVRYHSPKRVIEEMRILKEEYSADSIRFWDDSFTVNKKWVYEFCDLLNAENLNLPWSCFTRVDLVDEKILRKLKEAGCYQIYYGIESGSQRLLNLINKGITLDQARISIKLAKEAGIETICSYMLALPGETREESEQTIKFAIEIESDYVQISLTIPHISGEAFYKLCSQYGTILKYELHKATLYDYPTYIPYGRTQEELKECIRKAYKRFYLRPSYIIRRILKLQGLSLRKYFILFYTGLKVLLWKR